MNLTLTFAIAGFVELVKRFYAKDFETATIIVGSAVVGALLAPQVGLNWFTGLQVGLSASGVITAVSYVGSKS